MAQNIIYKVCWRVLTAAGDNRNMEQLFSSKTRAESFIDEINHAAKLLGVTTLNLIGRENIGEIILRDSE